MPATPPEAAHAIDWWVGAGGAVLAALIGLTGAIVGSFVPLAWAAWTRRKERAGEVLAMTVEMYHARIAMEALPKPDVDGRIVLAPLYHLPLTMFERALPKLIGEGLLTDNEVSALVEYVMRAEELNRGLDLATTAVASEINASVNVAVLNQYKRNVAKAAHILHEKQERLAGRTVFDVAETALYRLSDSPRDRQESELP